MDATLKIVTSFPSPPSISPFFFGYWLLEWRKSASFLTLYQPFHISVVLILTWEEFKLSLFQEKGFYNTISLCNPFSVMFDCQLCCCLCIWIIKSLMPNNFHCIITKQQVFCITLLFLGDCKTSINLHYLLTLLSTLYFKLTDLLLSGLRGLSLFYNASV